MILLKQMLIFFLIMLVGMAARKVGIITSDNQKQLSAMVVNIANPALILSGGMGNGERISGRQLMISVLVAAAIFAVMILIGKCLPALLHFPDKERRIVELMVVFSNIGFIGMPVVVGVYGESAMMYVTLFLIIYNVLVYTYGVQTIRTKESTAGNGIRLRSICNIGVLAGVLAIVLYLTQLKVPYVLSETISMLSKLTGPLSMMIIGSSMADISYKELVSDVRLLLFLVIKMLVLPVIFLLILKRLITNEMLLNVCLIMVAAPVGSMIAMFANQYDEANSELATKAVSLTTIVSIVTIPLVSVITGVG